MAAYPEYVIAIGESLKNLDKITDTHIQGFIYCLSDATKPFFTFKNMDYGGISFDPSNITGYNFDFQDPSKFITILKLIFYSIHVKN